MTTTETITAEPYQARRCPECDKWIFTDAAPFSENDRTKTERDWVHWERFHEDPATRESGPNGAVVIGFPFFTYNTEPVEAVYEHV